MSKVEKISSGTAWENQVGYSRAVKAGNHIFVSGTTAVDENGKIIGVGSSYHQTKYIFQKIEKALNAFGADLEDVVRTRIFVVNIGDWEEIGKAHGEFFKDIKPAATMVEINNLIDINLLVEIEVDAVITE